MDVLNNIFTPQGHESAMKQALYNTLAFVFVLVFAVTGVALYFILEPFLQPLLWALLFGSVLYPFKHSLSQALREWLENVQAPLAVAVATSPLTMLDSIAHSFISMIKKYLKLLAAIALVLLVAYFLPLAWLLRVLNVLNIAYGLAARLLGLLSTAYTMWSMAAAYVLLLLFNFNEQVAPVFRLLSPIMYVSIFCFVTGMLGALRIPVVLSVLGLIVIGFFAEIEDRGKCGPKTSERASTKVYDRMSIVEITVARKMKLWYLKLKDCLRSPEPVPEPCDEDEPLDGPDGLPRPPPLIQVDDMDGPPEEDASDDGSPDSDSSSRESDLYLIAVVWACVVMQIYRNLWFLPLMYIPLLYGMVKSICIRLNVTEWTSSMREGFDDWYEQRREAIMPDYLRPVIRLLLKGDHKIKHVLENSVDSITAVFVIILLFLVATVGTIFMAVQVYGESVYLIEITSGVINRTVVHNPELQQLVPDTIRNLQDALDSMIGDAYTYGKDWIRGSLRRLLDDKDPMKAEALEAEIVDLWDRVYQMWMQKNATELDGSKALAKPSWNTLLDGLKSLDVSAITNFVKDNLDTLQTVIDSLWVILKGNVTIFISVFTAILSVVFGGGTAVLNFVINFVIFTTALFYLLAASDSTYKPIQLLSRAIPNSKGKPISGLGKAVEQAINGVFALSFKMAFFYGLYTWLIHSLFAVNIIYIPSVIAAIFGAVPFLGTYWACLPACLELWLVNGNPVRAALMALAQFLPMLFVDTAIYSEIKGGGHPYLTGLAIAGGVFCMGVQGALFGPMLLCVLIAACNVYSKLVQKSNQTSAANVGGDGAPFSRAGSPKPRMKKRASFSGQLVTDKFD
ncbi:transmembrane protein-like [Tropilaelaps mercedesae]|uniref:Transmembrane protein-like n=1 Tax=Tropilaelaps mercedesae TaxID=418985 RepID=A0A1V9XQT1_9ACAR|nr:transmembrane protein-like [Tropilaelaps mercedesae]